MTEDLKESQSSSHTSELKKVTFQQFLFLLSGQALIALGSVPNPLTGKTEVNLSLVQHTIDVLAMLQDKTQGNLTSEEARSLDELLYDLRMRYVEAVQSQPARKKG